MNRVIKSVVLGFFLLSAGFAAAAQNDENSVSSNRPPRWVSSRGYWVVESNPAQPLHACVYFYTNVNVLVYKETIDGVRLSPSKTGTKMRLKKTLEHLLDAWEAGCSIDSANAPLAGAFKKEKTGR